MAGATRPSGEIIGLYVGKVEDCWPGKPPSAIAKTLMQGCLRLETTGFADDRQADMAVHGGPEKAVHHYASEHMAFWRQRLPKHAEQFMPGCFGENISTIGLNEANLCLGDVMSIGTATVQICQGRQPCWKLNAHTGLDDMAAHFQNTGRTGWYYRVVQEGSVCISDHMQLQERLYPDWPLQRLIRARFDTGLDKAVAAELAGLEQLSQSWQAAFLKKSSDGFVEDTKARLAGS